MKKILIVIPAYNEEKNIGAVVDEVDRFLGDYHSVDETGTEIQCDTLVVNDCSKDKTLDVLREKGASYLTLPINLGYAGAIQAGFKYALKYDYDYVVQYDGDGQHIALEAKKLIDRIVETNADIVIGSRFLGRGNYHHPFLKKIGTAFFVNFIRILTRSRISDPTSGFQILARNVFAEYARMGNFPQYPDANLVVEMLMRGYKVDETGVEMRERLHGVGMHVGLSNNAKYMLRMSYSIVLVFLRLFGSASGQSKVAATDAI